MDKTEKITFNTTLLLFIVIVLSTMIIFMLTPSPISAARRHFGYISAIYNQSGTIFLDFDPAEWLTDGQSDFPATLACIDNGDCPNCQPPPTHSCLPNGYYISNPESTLKTYKVAGFTKVGTLLVNTAWDQSQPDSQPYRQISLPELVDIFQNPSSPDYHLKSAPFDVTTIGGVVIIINQHYIP